MASKIDGAAVTGSRRWQTLVVAGVPFWAFFTLMIVVMHPGVHVDAGASIALRMVLIGSALGALFHAAAMRYLWPEPASGRSILVHAAIGALFSGAWLVLNGAADALVNHHSITLNVGPGAGPYFIAGVWIYSMIAGVSYATFASRRAAAAEAGVARAQLAALRSQINPHFLFNALHAIVHLIPVEPERASQAAEQLSGMLRATIDEERDLLPLRDELAFVRRYLGMEQLRFGDRLTVRVDIAPDTESLDVPSFGIHTLVENAVRHGVEPTIGPVVIAIRSTKNTDRVVVVVADTGRPAGAPAAAPGTGLERIRARLAALFGRDASLTAGPTPTGFEARLELPAREADG